MDRAGVGAVCLALPGVTLEHSFGEDHDVYKVGGKMFAMVGGSGGVSFKASDIAYAVLTEDGRARPAPYLARARWVQVDDPGDWSDDDLADHLRAGHGLVAARLPRALRASLGL